MVRNHALERLSERAKRLTEDASQKSQQAHKFVHLINQSSVVRSHSL